MSDDLAAKIQLGLEEFETVRGQMAPLIAKPVDSNVGDIETAAACAMLHSFYTEIEKILKLIAREWDGQMPSPDRWHKELLNQMAAPTSTRPAVITSDLVEKLRRVSRISELISRNLHCLGAVGQAFYSRREGKSDPQANDVTESLA